jgi:hypothetical protein
MQFPLLAAFFLARAQFPPKFKLHFRPALQPANAMPRVPLLRTLSYASDGSADFKSLAGRHPSEAGLPPLKWPPSGGDAAHPMPMLKAPS